MRRDPRPRRRGRRARTRDPDRPEGPLADHRFRDLRHRALDAGARRLCGAPSQGRPRCGHHRHRRGFGRGRFRGRDPHRQPAGLGPGRAGARALSPDGLRLTELSRAARAASGPGRPHAPRLPRLHLFLALRMAVRSVGLAPDRSGGRGERADQRPHAGRQCAGTASRRARRHGHRDAPRDHADQGCRSRPPGAPAARLHAADPAAEPDPSARPPHVAEAAQLHRLRAGSVRSGDQSRGDQGRIAAQVLPARPSRAPAPTARRPVRAAAWRGGRAGSVASCAASA